MPIPKAMVAGDDLHLVPDEPLLGLPAHGAVEAGVVGQGIYLVCPQVAGDLFGLAPGEAVDDG